MSTNGHYYALERCASRVFSPGTIRIRCTTAAVRQVPEDEIVGLAARALRAPLYAAQGHPGAVLSEPAVYTRAFVSGATHGLSGSAGYGGPNPRCKWRPSTSCHVSARLAG